MDFRKEREFGDIFGSTFEFIRQEFKNLTKVFFIYILPVLIISSILLVFAMKGYFENFTNMDVYNPDPFNMMGKVFTYMFLIMLTYAISHSAIITAIYSYITLYVKKGKDFDIAEVGIMFRRFYFPVLGTFILSTILIGVGTAFCLIPGIYLGVSMCLIFIALIFEEKGFGDAFSRTFQLTKLDWWWTLLTLFVVYVLITILSMVISLPVAAYSIGTMFTKVMQGGNPMESFSTTYIVLNSVISIVTNLLYVIPYIAIALHYFNLVEKLEKPSLEQKISQIGTNE